MAAGLRALVNMRGDPKCAAYLRHGMRHLMRWVPDIWGESYASELAAVEAATRRERVSSRAAVAGIRGHDAAPAAAAINGAHRGIRSRTEPSEHVADQGGGAGLLALLPKCGGSKAGSADV